MNKVEAERLINSWIVAQEEMADTDFLDGSSAIVSRQRFDDFAEVFGVEPETRIDSIGHEYYLLKLMVGGHFVQFVRGYK